MIEQYFQYEKQILVSSGNQYLSYFIYKYFIDTNLLMQKLRDLYKETQKNAVQNFDRVTQQRVKKILIFANKQYEAILAKNDFTDLDEVTFYRQKFQQVLNTMNEAQEKGYKKQKVQAEFINILKQNFGQPNQQQRQVPSHPRQHSNNRGIVENRANQDVPASLIKSYFDGKREEIQKSKIGFKSVIQNIPFVPRKFPVKHSPKHANESSAHKITDPSKDEQIKSLKDEIARLKQALQEKQSQKQFNFGLLQIQKKQYEQRVKQLSQELKYIQAQNASLKEQSAKNYQLPHKPYFEINPPKANHQFVEEVEQHGQHPYQIKFRQNDINKINNKLTKQKGGNSKNNGNPAYQINNLMKQLDKQQDYYRSQMPVQFKNQEKFKNSYDVVNKSKNSPPTPNIEEHAIALRSKTSFFKSSMIIYKGDQIEIAVKSLDQIRLQKKKVILYINNKTSNRQVIKFNYKYDPHYYEVYVRKKLASVDELTQGKQQVQVKLVNTIDLDSLIQVQLTVNTKNIAFILPAMFIEFLDKRPELVDQSKYQTQRIIPIHQFSTLHSAEEYLPIQKIYGQHEQSGMLYAMSKSHQGYIFLKWVGGQLEIRTISAWKFFLGYLLLKQY